MLKKTNTPLLITLLAAATIAAAGTACTTRKSKSKNLTLKDPVAAPIPMAEVAEGETVAPKGKQGNRGKRTAAKAPKGESNTAANASPASPAIDAQTTAACTGMMQRMLAAYTALYKELNQATYTTGQNGLSRIQKLSAADCKDADKADQAIAAMTEAVSDHSGRAGVMLPTTGARAKYVNLIIAGMRAAYADMGLKFEDHVVIKDSGGTAQSALKALADLVYRDRVSIVIGGVEKAEAETLSAWAEKLMLPVVLISREREFTRNSTFVFSLYPDEYRLAATLAEAARKRGLRRVAVLKPTGGKSDRIADYFKILHKDAGGTVTADLIYTPNNFDSMLAVSRQLFRTDASERAHEYRAAYQRARRQAQKEGVPFDPRMVVLKPIVDFDAVFIPDDFRTVRHMAKMFRYHMVDKLPLLGNHEWRSPALIEPFDEFMEGSIFADFIGSYTKLPRSIGANVMGSPYFVEPASVVTVDFKLIGYRAARAFATATGQKDQPRRTLATRMQGGTIPDQEVFSGGRIFDAERHANWPTYVFTVSKGNLSLEPGIIPAMKPQVQGTTPPPGQKGAAASWQPADRKVSSR